MVLGLTVMSFGVGFCVQDVTLLPQAFALLRGEPKTGHQRLKAPRPSNPRNGYLGVFRLRAVLDGSLENQLVHLPLHL